MGNVELRGRSGQSLACFHDCRHAVPGARSRNRRHRVVDGDGQFVRRHTGHNPQHSTLGQRLADSLDAPFVELNREIERVSGCGLAEIHNLLGPNAYRRYERRALEETIQLYPDAVIATPGGIVSDASNFNLLLANCFTVWLKASPEEHMSRVIAQGDFRPMAASGSGAAASGRETPAAALGEAMDDLKRILAGRAAFYSKADIAFDTSGKSLDESAAALLAMVTAATLKTQ